MRTLHCAAALTFVAALTLPGCATMTASAYVAPGVGFAGYHTFAWGPADALPTGDPRLDNNPFFHDYMQGAVVRHLAGRGIAVVESTARPDLLLHYHANVTQRFDLVADRTSGYCATDCGGRVIDYEQGTIVLDIVDPATNRLVWRGWAQESLSGIIDSQARLEREVERAVTRMLERLPVR